MTDEKTVALVSGVTGVIGHAIAMELAATPGYEVVLLARDESRAKLVAHETRRDTGNDTVRVIITDV
jgi:short-subunit dehydrogenase